VNFFPTHGAGYHLHGFHAPPPAGSYLAEAGITGRKKCGLPGHQPFCCQRFVIIHGSIHQHLHQSVCRPIPCRQTDCRQPQAPCHRRPDRIPVQGLAFNRSGFNGFFNQNFRLGFAAEFQTQGVHFAQQAALAPARPAKRLNQRIIVPCELRPVCILPHITHYSLLIDSYFEAIIPVIRFKNKHFI